VKWSDELDYGKVRKDWLSARVRREAKPRPSSHDALGRNLQHFRRFLYAQPSEESDEAFVWLNRAYQKRSYLLTYLTVDERLDNLHSDPRFDELRRQVGIPALKR
jgi:hypothetical protein